MPDIPTADRGRRIHRVRFSDADTCIALDIEQLPQLRLLGVIRTCRITRRGPDTPVFLLNELLVGERLLRRITPELTPHTLMEVLGARLGETVRQGLQHDARVVIMRLLEASHVLVDAQAGSDGERS